MNNAIAKPIARLRQWCLVAAFFWSGMAAAQTQEQVPPLAQWLQQPSLQFGETVVSTDALRDSYAGTQFQPIWVDAQGLTPRAQKALEVIANANTHGLNPELYAVSTIRAIAAMPRSDASHALQINLSLDVLMSHAVMHYASDMGGGVARHQWDTGQENAASRDQKTLFRQVAMSADTAAYLQSLAPTLAQYTALKAALQRYQSIAGAGGWPQFQVGKPIKSGAIDGRIPTIRQILAVQGDLAASTAVQADRYDAPLQEAIKHFQQRHGIAADGVIGSGTQTALNVPVADRVEQIALTLERMRWMPADLGSRYVLVNIPSYSLKAVSGNAQLDMPVIVGANATKTPMFSKSITNVVLNPSWGVPAKIAVNEMLPKVRKNPDYLKNAGYTVTNNGGQVIDASEVDWSTVSKHNFSYSFRQNPGSRNALGKVKFTIPDSDNIYLHDTSQPALFSRADRNLSHGCVRLSDPEALTQFVLTSEGWNPTKIRAAYASGASKTVPIAPLPIHLVYWTTWVDSYGHTHFSRDVYGMDKSLLLAMRLPDKHKESIKLAMN